MKAILQIFLVFLSTTLLAQNIPSIEQVEAELEELKKKDNLRAYTLELARQRDSLIEVFDRQSFNLEQELSSTEASLSQLEFDFDNAMTSIDALNQNKKMLENKNSQQAIEISELHAQIIELNTTISDLESSLTFSHRDTLLPVNNHPDAQLTMEMLGISLTHCSNSSKYFPLRDGDEEPTEEHKSPLFYQWNGVSAEERYDKRHSPVLVLNVSNQLVLLPLKLSQETIENWGGMDESEEVEKLMIYENSQFKAELNWTNVTGGGISCENFGCFTCEGRGTGFCHLKIYKNGQLFYDDDIAECSLNYEYCY